MKGQLMNLEEVLKYFAYRLELGIASRMIQYVLSLAAVGPRAF